MIKIEEKLKENGKLADFERAVLLNDLQSIYSIVEDLIDNSEPVKSVVLDLASHCDLTEEEQEERRDLMMLRADSTRFFHQCELDRLNEINDKMFLNSKNPHCN
jgi:hypothetical protein